MDGMLAGAMRQCAYLCLVIIGHDDMRHQSTSDQMVSSACSSDDPATTGTPYGDTSGSAISDSCLPREDRETKFPAHYRAALG
jgi:hypothetical protein